MRILKTGRENFNLNAKGLTMEALKERQARIELLTKKEVANFWRVTTRTIDRLVSQGKLPFVRLPGGRTIRFRATDLDKTVEAKA